MTKKFKYVLIPRIKRHLLGHNRGSIKYNIAAFAFTKKGNLLDIRYNNFRNYMSHRKGAGIHAELDLIQKHGNMIDTIYIIRVGMGGDILPIQPCNICSKIAEKMNIKIIPLQEELNIGV